MADRVYYILVALSLTTVTTSECSPSTGIYMMLGGQCISNGTYFRDSDLQIANGQDGYIHCVLPGETLDGGQWLRPDGEPVNCTTGGDGYKYWWNWNKLKDPFFCTDDSPNANITLYLLNDDYFTPTVGLMNDNLNENIETQYKCCLPTNCSDPNTNIMTINVFERVYITDVYVDLPSDITAIPQYYTVHCIVTGSLDDATIKHYYDDNSDIELTQSYCTDTHDGYSCSVDSQSITTNYTYSDTGDYTVTFEWEGKTISNGTFRQSQHDGDHVHVCTAASGAVGPILNGQILPGRYIDLIVKAPSFSPSIPTLVSSTLTSITINWTYPAGVSDVDGFVVNASSDNDYRIGLVNTSDVTTTTLSGLFPGTTYIITVRAYQDILGPPSDVLVITTLDVSPIISWSLVSPITNLLDTQYTVRCVTSNINPTLVYWTVNDVEITNTNYTLVNESDSTYNSTLLLYPNNELGQSVTITCSVEGVLVRKDSVILKAPCSVPEVIFDVLTDTSINISWSITDSDININGFVVTVVSNGSINGSSIVFNSSVSHTVFTNLTPGVSYTISVLGYKDLLSVKWETTVTLSVTTVASTLSLTKTSVAPPVTSSIHYTIFTSTVMTTATVGGEVNCGAVGSIIGGTVGGCTFLVIMLVISVIIHIILVMVSKSRNKSPTQIDDHLYDQIDNKNTLKELHSAQQHRDVDRKQHVMSADNIEMHPCEPYSLHKPANMRNF